MFFAEGKKISFQCAKIAMLQRVFAHVFCRRQKDFISMRKNRDASTRFCAHFLPKAKRFHL